MSNAEIIASFIAAWEARDVDRIMTFFAPGATYHNMPTPKMTGHDQIRAFIAPFLAGIEKVDFEIVKSAEGPDGTVLNERVDIFRRKSGKMLRFEVMGVFELTGGKISAWRDYFDGKEAERQIAG